MSISVFDLFSIGLGPSSSHSVGPMRAAKMFANRVFEKKVAQKIDEIQVRLYGSLALTGKGHGTDIAVILGLLGEAPETVDPDSVDVSIAKVRETKTLNLLAKKSIPFDMETNILFQRKEQLPYHPNGMRFIALVKGTPKLIRSYYSVGGGFVLSKKEAYEGIAASEGPAIPFPFNKGDELLKICKEKNCRVSDIMLENEKTWRSEEEIRSGLLNIWHVMEECVKRGCSRDGELPGGLKVKRRAARIYRSLASRPESGLRDPLSILDWVDLYALAVNEENAAGGRVVTAPTNGAAGIIPAVLHYYVHFVPKSNDDGIVRFLLTAAAIGMLYKKNASISGAEVGCQGEVGVACSMAAGALTEVLDGSVLQVEQAAEIGMEHNLGLTCDPIGGLVQVPCIERNAMGAVKAINASRLALRGDGEHRVSLDKVIETMRRTGKDMSRKYKETSRGGLAVNVIEC
ncbi:MAG: L-serine ammonia-lyase [Pirellulaceae bacterium]